MTDTTTWSDWDEPVGPKVRGPLDPPAPFETWEEYVEAWKPGMGWCGFCAGGPKDDHYGCEDPLPGCTFCGGEGHYATAHDQSEVW